MCRYLGCVFCVVAVLLVVGGPASAQATTPYDQTIINNNPVIYWPMTEAVGATTVVNYASGSNSAGSAGNGTYGFTPRTSPNLGAAFTGTWPTGVVPAQLVNPAGGLPLGTYNGFSNTTGTGTYMPAGAIPNLDPGQGAYSIEFWWAENDTSLPGYLFNWQTTGGTNGTLQIFYRNSSDLRIYFQPTSDSTKTARIDTTAFNFTANTMYDMVVTYTPGTYVVGSNTLYGKRSQI
jgi:hypothetical protein